MPTTSAQPWAARQNDLRKPQDRCSTIKNDVRHSSQRSDRGKLRCRPIIRPEPGSIYDIMFEHSGTSLQVLPILWTDLHSRLLGVRFQHRQAVDSPMPNTPYGAWIHPTKLGGELSAELSILLEMTSAVLVRRNRAMKNIMQTLFPQTLAPPQTQTDLDLYFGDRVFRKVVRVDVLWKNPELGSGASFDSAATIPISTSFRIPNVNQTSQTNRYNHPMLAYISRSQLAKVRRNLFRISPGPNNKPNLPVARLQNLRSRLLIPGSADHDSYYVAVLLAMAQSHFYGDSNSPSSTQSSQPGRVSTRFGSGGYMTVDSDPPTFESVKVMLLTHANDTADFVVYTAIVSPTFLRRFSTPQKAPIPEEGCDLFASMVGGLEISYQKVPIWPILGLKERLGQALGSEIGGTKCFQDPGRVIYWQDWVESIELDMHASFEDVLKLQMETRVPVSKPEPLKRSRGCDFLTTSGSVADDDDGDDDVPVMSPDAKRRRVGRSASTLEVC